MATVKFRALGKKDPVNLNVRFYHNKMDFSSKSNIFVLFSDWSNEVPAFAYYLNRRELVSPMKTRMWFTKQQIHTKALEILIKGNKTSLEKELEEMIQDEFSVFDEPFLCYTAKNLVAMLKFRGLNTSSNYISKTLNTRYNMFYEKNSSYEWYRSAIFDEKSPNLSGFTNEKGRYFKFEREKFLNQVES